MLWVRALTLENSWDARLNSNQQNFFIKNFKIKRMQTKSLFDHVYHGMLRI